MIFLYKYSYMVLIDWVCLLAQEKIEPDCREGVRG